MKRGFQIFGQSWGRVPAAAVDGVGSSGLEHVYWAVDVKREGFQIWNPLKALFSSKIFYKINTVSFLFVFDKYYLIIN